MTRRPASSRWPRTLVLAACSLVVAAASGEEPAPSAGDALQQQIRSVFDKCQSAIVRIEARDVDGKLAGTGFFIDPNGTLFTSYSVGGEAQDLVVVHGSMKYPATRLISDSRTGVAILKVEAQTPFLTAGKSRELGIASPVITVGYPLDLPITPSFGIVGGFDIRYLGRYFATTHIRANVPVQRGEGGSPLLNLRGEVVGIMISSLDNGSASHVLPIEAAEKVRRDYSRFREVRPGWIGMQVVAAEESIHGSTAEIRGIVTDSPAEKAGLLRGDMLLQVGDRSVKTPEDVLDAVYYISVDEELPVRVVRDEETMDFKVQPADHPHFRRTPPNALGTANDLRLPPVKMEK